MASKGINDKMDNILELYSIFSPAKISIIKSEKNIIRKANIEVNNIP